jgi:NAD-dependent SIR2 family protein deacetylase
MNQLHASLKICYCQKDKRQFPQTRVKSKRIKNGE